MAGDLLVCTFASPARICQPPLKSAHGRCRSDSAKPSPVNACFASNVACSIPPNATSFSCACRHNQHKQMLTMVYRNATTNSLSITKSMQVGKTINATYGHKSEQTSRGRVAWYHVTKNVSGCKAVIATCVIRAIAALLSSLSASSASCSCEVALSNALCALVAAELIST